MKHNEKEITNLIVINYTCCQNYFEKMLTQSPDCVNIKLIASNNCIILTQLIASMLHNDSTISTTCISDMYCNKPCTRSEGCFNHWKSKPRVYCKKLLIVDKGPEFKKEFIQCSKPTASECGLCKKHANSYYVIKCVYGLQKFTPTPSKIYI